MSDDFLKKTQENNHVTGSAKDSHYARLRKAFRDKKKSQNTKEIIQIYGYHAAIAALENPHRKIHRIFLTKNSLERVNKIVKLDEQKLNIVEPKAISNMLAPDAVHQGILIECDPLKIKKLSTFKNKNLLLVLDQITDPHNVGAIMRSATALNVSAIITTARHSAKESATMAKSASGALEYIEYVNVQNLAEALIELKQAGYQTIGLDSEGEDILENTFCNSKIALVLGAEGKGLRQKTRATVDNLARLDMPGKIKSLNVSNAAAISLYAAHKFLTK